MKKARKRSRKSLKAEADKVVSHFVRQRDRRCIVCGSTENLQCGHLYTRANYSTRWDLQNCWCQCAGCNVRHEHQFKPMYDAVVAMGVDVDALWVKHNRVSKLSNADIEEIIGSIRYLAGRYGYSLPY